MDNTTSFPLIAVDIGNSQIKLGRFDEAPAADSLPEPDSTLQLDTDHWDPLEIALWLAPYRPADLCWRIASVHGDATAKMAAWLVADGAEQSTQVLRHDLLPLKIQLPDPGVVGIDRLLGAVAANCLRDSSRPAIVVDLGTAITIDVVAADGSFQGGAILPGIGMSTRALTQYTHQLPDIGLTELIDPPPALGTSTHEAITSGIYWGAIGAVRLLMERMSAELIAGQSGEESAAGAAQIFLTGGAAHSVAEHFGEGARYEPNLILAGLVLGSLG